MCQLERNGGRVTSGVRAIAELAFKGKSCAAKSVGRLIELGHATKIPAGKGKRASYQLTAEVFTGKKQGKKQGEKVSTYVRTLRKVAACITPGCRHMRPVSRLSGLCNACTRDAHTERIARKVVRQAMQA